MTENDFSFNAVDAKIHGLSVQVGELFADLYAKSGTDSTKSAECLEAYRSLRRLLPKQSDGVRHVGARGVALQVDNAAPLGVDDGVPAHALVVPQHDHFALLREV